MNVDRDLVFQMTGYIEGGKNRIAALSGGWTWENCGKAKRRLAHAFRFRCGKSADKKLFVPAEHLPRELLTTDEPETSVDSDPHFKHDAARENDVAEGGTMLEHVFSHFGWHFSTRCILSACASQDVPDKPQVAAGRGTAAVCVCVSRSLHTGLEHRTRL